VRGGGGIGSGFLRHDGAGCTNFALAARKFRNAIQFV
jgi:hypothetical protein